MRGLLTYGGAGMLIALILWAAATVLPACGGGGRIAWTWSEWCPVNSNLNADNEIDALTDANRLLERSILQRERELAQLQCTPKVVAQAPLPAPVPPQQTLPEEIDPQDWNSRRIGLLEGCWELESKFVTTNRETGERSLYQEWSMCFDRNGSGREEMRANNGNTCRGPIEGRFDPNGALVIEEPENLQCSDGGFIYRLRSQCRLNKNGTANCVVTQPEGGGTTTVEFRRSAREN